MQHVKAFDATTNWETNWNCRNHQWSSINTTQTFPNSHIFPGVQCWANIIDKAHRCMGVLSTEKMPITKLVGENAETQIVIRKDLFAARKWLQLLGKNRMWITWMWKPFIWYMLSIIAKHIICIAEAKRQQKSDLFFHDMAYYIAWSSLVSNTLETCLA